MTRKADAVCLLKQRCGQVIRNIQRSSLRLSKGDDTMKQLLLVEDDLSLIEIGRAHV